MSTVGWRSIGGACAATWIASVACSPLCTSTGPLALMPGPKLTLIPALKPEPSSVSVVAAPCCTEAGITRSSTRALVTLPAITLR